MVGAYGPQAQTIYTSPTINFNEPNLIKVHFISGAFEHSVLQVLYGKFMLWKMFYIAAYAWGVQTINFPYIYATWMFKTLLKSTGLLAFTLYLHTGTARLH